MFYFPYCPFFGTLLVLYCNYSKTKEDKNMEFLFFALAGAYVTICIEDARKEKARARRKTIAK